MIRSNLLICFSLLAACAGQDMPQGAQPGDLDGDGLDDVIEVTGWTVRVEGDGSDARAVHSDPDRADTDGDGLTDLEEWELRLDPQRADTDGDGLSDFDEVHVYRSRGHHVDSDGDSGGDVQFWDGNEVRLHQTSPALADTDGDGLDDRVEVVELFTDPRIADLARPRFALTNPVISVSGSRTDSEQIETGLGVDVSVGQGFSTTETHSFTESLALTRSLDGGLNGGLSLGTAISGNLGGNLGFGLSEQQGFEQSASLAATESANLSRSLQRTRSEVASSAITLDGGTIRVTADLINDGPLAVTLTYAAISVLRRDPSDRRVLMPVTSLEPRSGRSGFPRQTIGPGQAVRGIVFVDQTLDWQEVMPLLADPSSLVFQVSLFEFEDASGVAWRHNETAIHARTAAIIIDRGPGHPPPSHARFQVAAAVRYTPDGPEGIRVGDVLRAQLQRDFATARAPMGQHAVLAQLDGLQANLADPQLAAWLAVLVRAGDAAPSEITVDFADLRLFPGDQLRLIYDEDRDRDGLGFRTEARLGTDDTASDTDGDGLSDAEEAIDGWPVATTPPRHAFSDPASADDADGDGLDDRAERAQGTDPRFADTDGDGLDDAIDAAPVDFDAVHLVGLRAWQPADLGGVRLEWTWPDTPAVAGLVLLRQPATRGGAFNDLPAIDDAAALAVGDTVGDATVVFVSDRGATGFDDLEPALDTVYRYHAVVRYADRRWIPSGAVISEFVAPVGLYDRLALSLVAIEVKRDNCDPGGDPELYWAFAVDGGVVFQQTVNAAVEVDDRLDLSHLQVQFDQAQGDAFVFGGWIRDQDSLDADDFLGEMRAEHTSADDWGAGAEHRLTFFDQADGPDKCRLDLVYRVDVVERDLRP